MRIKSQQYHPNHITRKSLEDLCSNSRSKITLEPRYNDGQNPDNFELVCPDSTQISAKEERELMLEALFDYIKRQLTDDMNRVTIVHVGRNTQDHDATEMYVVLCSRIPIENITRIAHSIPQENHSKINS